MISEVERETLRCLDRPSLEYQQIHSRYLRALVDRNAYMLSLRRIHSVRILNGGVYIRLVEGGHDIGLPAWTGIERNLEELYQRISNAYIERLQLSFAHMDRPFLFYMRTAAVHLQCRVRLLGVNYITPWRVDHAIVAFLGHSLRPTVYEARMGDVSPKDAIMLFSRDSLSDSIKQLVYKLGSHPVPQYIIKALVHNDTVESCAFTLDSDPRHWITQFVEEFRNITRDAPNVCEILLLHLRNRCITPLRQPIDLDPLGQALCPEVPTPNNAFIIRWCLASPVPAIESRTATLYEYENTDALKKLRVHTWTIKQPVSLHYVYLLQVTPR